MKQFTYEQQQNVVKKQISIRTLYIIVGCILAAIILLIVVIIVGTNISKDNECNDMEELIGTAAIEYIGAEKIILTAINPTAIITLDELYDSGFLTKLEITVDDSLCGGEVKITKVNDGYITTPNLINCDYCTTDSRYGEYSEPSEGVPNADIVDVLITYNYVEKEVNYSPWTNYYEPSYLIREPIESYDDSRFGKISEDAKNPEIISEDKNYYRYKDQRWKFYKYNNTDYSDFSSVQPTGYSKKDSSTIRNTEWSNWSLNAPAIEDYRTIEKKTGYRWYYEKDGEIYYYDSGSYVPTAPDDLYTEKDEKDSATVYRYTDEEWRWYNGEARSYSSYMTTATTTYPYKDTELTSFSSYSSWSETSRLDSSTSGYRVEEIQVRTRYRLKYEIYSFNKLDEFVESDDFFRESGMTLEEVYNSDEYEVIVKYEYIGKK